VSLSISGVTVNVAGIDDAHYDRDDSAKAIGALRELGDSGDVVLGVAHAPYLRVVDALAEAKVDLILCGHTHGGQIRLPRIGSLVTNSDLPNKYSKGLARYQGDTWLHVSAGLGTSPFAPVRIGCPPEATLLELSAN
jgi:predicted MPP superfamily phosphohydrolase